NPDQMFSCEALIQIYAQRQKVNICHPDHQIQQQWRHAEQHHAKCPPWTYKIQYQPISTHHHRISLILSISPSNELFHPHVVGSTCHPRCKATLTHTWKLVVKQRALTTHLAQRKPSLN